MNTTALEEWAGHTFLLQILHTPGVFLSICVGHSLQRFQGRFSAAGAGWGRSSSVPIIFRAFLTFHFDSFGLKATLYVIIGEFLTKVFQELSASSLSIIERPVWIQ